MLLVFALGILVLRSSFTPLRTYAHKILFYETWLMTIYALSAVAPYAHNFDFYALLMAYLRSTLCALRSTFMKSTQGRGPVVLLDHG